LFLLRSEVLGQEVYRHQVVIVVEECIVIEGLILLLCMGLWTNAAIIGDPEYIEDIVKRTYKQENQIHTVGEINKPERT
jgi:hypothetical protein